MSERALSLGALDGPALAEVFAAKAASENWAGKDIIETIRRGLDLSGES